MDFVGELTSRWKTKPRNALHMHLAGIGNQTGNYSDPDLGTAKFYPFSRFSTSIILSKKMTRKQPYVLSFLLPVSIDYFKPLFIHAVLRHYFGRTQFFELSDQFFLGVGRGIDLFTFKDPKSLDDPPDQYRFFFP